MTDNSLFCTAICTGERISSYCTWRNIKHAYNNGMSFKCKEIGCKQHLNLYFCSHQWFQSRPLTLLCCMLYLEGMVIFPCAHFNHAVKWKVPDYGQVAMIEMSPLPSSSSTSSFAIPTPQPQSLPTFCFLISVGKSRAELPQQVCS